MADDAMLRHNAVRDIEDAFRPTHDEVARQGLVSALRKHAIVDMKAALQADYETRVQPRLADEGRIPKDWREIETAMETEPSYRFYSTIRYHAQEMCYQSVLDPIERGLPEMIEIAREAAAVNPAEGSLRTDPQFKVPPYVSALDVHLAPGCFHTEHTVDDVAQGAIVFLGGKVFGGANPIRRREGAVGESISHWLKLRYPDFQPRRVLDMGTTSGRNLFPYAQTYPGLELHGIDVGAPPLRFGFAQASHAGQGVHFSQQNAEATDYPDGHFDLIVSSFFFHEVPLKATRRILKECYRLLAPGGIIAHMELPPEQMVSDYENFFWNWDTANNNEPSYTVFRAQDPIALCAEAGFERDACFATIIPNYASFGEEKLREFVAGRFPPLTHGGGGWFVFGGRKAG
jgi:SAM-dependent methyltransferase